MKCQSLVSKTNVQQTFISKLVRASEAPKTETVVDGDTNNGLADLDRLLDDEREIVALVRASAYNSDLVPSHTGGSCDVPFVNVPPWIQKATGSFLFW